MPTEINPDKTTANQGYAAITWFRPSQMENTNAVVRLITMEWNFISGFTGTPFHTTVEERVIAIVETRGQTQTFHNRTLQLLTVSAFEQPVSGSKSFVVRPQCRAWDSIGGRGENGKGKMREAGLVKREAGAAGEAAGGRVARGSSLCKDQTTPSADGLPPANPRSSAFICGFNTVARLPSATPPRCLCFGKSADEPFSCPLVRSQSPPARGAQKAPTRDALSIGIAESTSRRPLS